MRFGNHLDLGKAELRNARMMTVGALPAAADNAGILVFYDNVLYWSDGSSWIPAQGGSGTPTGAAGGALTGFYPNPTLADGAVTTSAKVADSILTLAKFAPGASDAAAGTASLRSLGTGAAQAAAGDDARLSDQRVPTDGSVTGGSPGAGVKIASGTITDVNVAAANKDGAAGTASMRTLGTSATQAAAGNDARFTDQRVPTDNSVDSSKIQDGSIAAIDLADGIITGGTAGAGVKIAALTITNANISATAAIALSKLATDPLARANHTGTQLAATISDLASVVQAYRLDQFAAPTAPVAFGNQRITGLGTPTAGTDAATKAYVDGIVQSTDYKDSVRVATTANGTLATAFANGQTVDGVALVTGDRILLKNQTAPAENGIYTINASGAPTRATDADGNGEISAGSQVYVEAGTANGAQIWVVSSTTAATWVPGTSGSTWVLYFAVTPTQAGAGLTAAGNVLAVGAGTGITVNADDVAINTTVVARKAISNALGDGSALAYTFTHSLGNQWVVVQVVSTGSPFDEIITDIERTDANTVTARFASAPAAGSFRIVVIG